MNASSRPEKPLKRPGIRSGWDVAGDHVHMWVGAGAVMGKGMDDAVYVALACTCGATRVERLSIR